MKTELESPYTYFKHYFPEEIFDRFAEKTNLFSVKYSGRSIQSNKHKIKNIFLMHITTGILKFSRLKLYRKRKKLTKYSCHIWNNIL